MGMKLLMKNIKFNIHILDQTGLNFIINVILFILLLYIIHNKYLSNFKI